LLPAMPDERLTAASRRTGPWSSYCAAADGNVQTRPHPQI